MRTPNGLARAAVRFSPAAFTGTFVALVMAALIVSGCGILLETGLRASVPPQRYAGAPVLVAADQNVHRITGSGDDRDDEAIPLPDRARLDNSLVAKAASVPGARSAVADITFPVLGDRGALTGHGWGATAFTGERLGSGRAPRTGEIVVTRGVAAVGDRVTLTTANGPHRVIVSGVTVSSGATPTVWFTDSEAAAVSGHPGRIDTIAVLPADGVTPAELKKRVAHALGSRAQVHTGTGRGAVEDTSLGQARELLTALGGSFGGTATMVAVFTAAATVALSVGRRAREFALLRAIGATPRQIRRTIATEALLMAPLAGLLGCLPGIALAHWWFGQLRDRGAVPGAVQLSVSWIPLVSAVGAVLLTALVAGLAAARRAARIKPGRALAEAAVERIRPGWIRTPLGIAAVAGGFVCAGLASSLSGDEAAGASLGIVFLFMLATALLGPLLARAAAALFGLPLRGAGASASLAVANSRTNARRMASAITPIVLAMAFAATLVFMHTSEVRAADRQLRAATVADHIVSSGTGLPPDTVARAERLPDVTAAVALLKTAVLVPTPGNSPQQASAQGVTGSSTALARVQDLDVRKGTLSLRPGQVAIDIRLADAARVGIGDRLRLYLPDGTKAAPEVVATYGRGLGVSQVTLPASALAAHVTSPFATELWTRGGSAKALAPFGTVLDRGDRTAASSEERELSAWANAVMAAVLGGFAAIAAGNTLVMTVLDRRREFGMLRLVGGTRRQILRMVRWEALLVTLVGITLGTAIALATLVPMAQGITGEAPYVPPVLYGAFVAAALILGLTATALPARAALRGTLRR